MVRSSQEAGCDSTRGAKCTAGCARQPRHSGERRGTFRGRGIVFVAAGILIMHRLHSNSNYIKFREGRRRSGAREGREERARARRETSSLEISVHFRKLCAAAIWQRRGDREAIESNRESYNLAEERFLLKNRPGWATVRARTWREGAAHTPCTCTRSW